MAQKRDHGGGLDRAIRDHGGEKSDWIDLSTGINPVPYPIGEISQNAWCALPDSNAFAAIKTAARRFWNVPDGAEILPTAGASAAIARLPILASPSRVSIPAPTYNEHAAAFKTAGWDITQNPDPAATAQVLVHPNNPDGRLWQTGDITAPLCVIDESFCDITPDQTHVDLADQPGRIVLKSFGKFWGLAGLRLGFVIGHPDTIAPIREALGPWQVSGPALAIGTRALNDPAWADKTRARLTEDAARLDRLMAPHGRVVGGTPLFRLYDVGDAAGFQNRLARAHIWSRIFPYSTGWLRLGLPPKDRWDHLEAAL